MTLYNYKKYKISQSADSKSVQGLQTGDIVRRQYFDTPNLIYTLMVVISTGVEFVNDQKIPYFIGALLEGDAPQNGEMLDFVRMTNLYNPDRTGALYLTASDNNSPYIDIIDGLVSDNALTYPTNINKYDSLDPVSHHIVPHTNRATANHIACSGDNNRTCEIPSITNKVIFGGNQSFSRSAKPTHWVLITAKAHVSRGFLSPLCW